MTVLKGPLIFRCLDCDGLGDNAMKCEACGSKTLWPETAWLNRPQKGRKK